MIDFYDVSEMRKKSFWEMMHLPFWGKIAKFCANITLFSWVPIFVDSTKMTHSWGSKFVTIVFSFIIHAENH